MRCYGNHPLTLPILFTKGDSRDTQTIHMEIGSNGQTAPDTCSALDTDFSNITSTQFLDLRVRGGNCRKIDGNSDGFSGVAANIDRLAARGKFSQKSIQRVRTKKNRAKYTSPLRLDAFKELCLQQFNRKEKSIFGLKRSVYSL